jgi:uncharacterized protein (TIGR00369 family)
VAEFLKDGSYPVEPRTVADLLPLWPGTALEAFGLVLKEVDEDRLVLEMAIRPDFLQPAGLLHGGISLFLAESAASLHACHGVDLRRRQPVGIEINASHLRSVREGTLTATARVVRRSRSLIVHQVMIAHRDTGRELCACRVTNYYRETE